MYIYTNIIMFIHTHTQIGMMNLWNLHQRDLMTCSSRWFTFQCFNSGIIVRLWRQHCSRYIHYHLKAFRNSHISVYMCCLCNGFVFIKYLIHSSLSHTHIDILMQILFNTFLCTLWVRRTFFQCFVYKLATDKCDDMKEMSNE